MITSIAQYIDTIVSLNKTKNLSECQVFYRGESADYGSTKCIPSIFRKENLIRNEHKLFRDFIIANPEAFTECKLAIDALTIMAHYGLPTRLLDVTTNALIALYMCFQSDDKIPKDNPAIYVIYVPNKLTKYYDSDTVSVISNLAKINKPIVAGYYTTKIEDICENDRKQYIDRFNKEKNMKYLLHSIKDEKPYFLDKIHPEHLSTIVHVKPKKNNLRVRLQNGSFLLFGNHPSKHYKPALLAECGIKMEKIVISAQAKPEIMQQFEFVGISKESVYPDMEKVADYLRVKYEK